MRKFRLPDETGIFLVLLVVLVVLSILSPSFGTVHNGLTLLLNGAVIAFLALGQTFVLLTGGIDLSTGANVAMTGVLAAVLMQHLPWPVASLLAVGAGLVLGVINGLIIHYVKVPPFIVTFSTQGVATAVPLIITGANSISVRQAGFSWIGQGRVAGVPLPVIMLLVAAVAAGWFLTRTRLGVHVYASGGNKSAARLAGVDIRVVTILAYAVSGVCGGIAGLIATSRLMVGFPATGLGNELFFSIAAAVVGGVSLFGGIGTVAGAMIGAVLIASVSNGMNVLNVSSYWQSLVIGLIILLGVSFDTYRRGLSGKSLLSALTSTSRKEPQKEKEPTAV
ncbi:ABC transporter permease [Streptomyces sp. NPDC093544]|jgi:ribose transport system permease protein|uniref:ABC transporter permease n=1 Tax=Streptomyces sp. NPDC093544 TaxID=3155200 RepID=UPI00341794F8